MSRREFRFVEGTSSKFWAIELNASRFTVVWGRIGTAGQTQTKEFPSDAAARKEYDKLVAEKLKKGYKEESGAGASATAPAAAPAKAAPKPASPKPVSPKSATAAQQAPTAALSAPPAKPDAAVNWKVERRIKLAPEDWATAAWRPRQILPRPQSAPLDMGSCVARVAKVAVGTYGWDWKWSTAGIPLSMTAEEAHFWLCAMTRATKGITPQNLADDLAKGTYRKIGRDEVVELLKSKLTSVTPEVLLPLVNLLSITELLEMLAEPVAKNNSGLRAGQPWHGDPSLVFGLRDYVMPFLSDAGLQSVRQFLRPLILPQNWPTDHYQRPPLAFFLAALARLSEQLLPVVQSWKEGFYAAAGWDHSHYHQPQLIVLALASAPLVEAEMRRHKLPLSQSIYIRGWLATTEYAALDYVRDSVLAVTNREECEELLETFALVEAPEAAPHMLELKLSSKAPRVARGWLEANVGCAVAGLIPAAAGRGKLADAAIDFLREQKRAGQGDLIAQIAGATPPERVRKEVIEHVEKTSAPFDVATTPPWLASALTPAPRALKMPNWLALHALPPLTAGPNRLNDEQILAVLGTLQKSSLESPPALVSTLRAHVDAESRDAFAWRLFEQWLSDGAPSKDKWAMGAIGHLGGDQCVLRITPMIRNWPGESQHQRAVYGLDCLRAVGSDSALMALNGIAQKLKFKGLKVKAMEFMEAIATQRGISRAELEDRIVPDCDLNEQGTRIFDFGPRQFRLVLGSDMKPMIKDPEGKVRSDLPAANRGDDATQAAEALSTWKLLKKQVKEVAKIQAERLEQAMITGRRWTPDEFQNLLVKHPLTINLVRLVLWAGYGADGKVTTLFRVTEDQTLAGAEDRELTLPADVRHIGIVHPLHVADDQKKAWGEVFSDYEIVPPFEQLGRPIYTLEGDEKDAYSITRFGNVSIPATALVGTLERMAWFRGIPQDGGVFHEHSKPFYGANVTCIVQYEIGVPVGYLEGWEDQQNLSAFFISGVYKPTIYPDHKNQLKLPDVDPVVLSEVIKDLALVASKGQ